MFTITIQVPQDVLDAGAGSVSMALYGELLVSYTPQGEPTIPANTWVYYTGSDYAPASAVSSVPACATYTTTDPQTLTLPDVPVASAHLVFGVGSLPAIPVNSSNQPEQPTPTMNAATIYDFVELTYNTSFAVFVNTSSIDQFGIPIQIQIDPANSNLPQGAGVIADRAGVLSQFQAYVTASAPVFLQCTQDLFGNTLTARILSTNDAINDNCVQGVAANVGNAPPSTLAAGTYYYAVTALNAASSPIESAAQPNVVQATVTANQAVTVAWSPNAGQPAGIESYNVYRGTASGSSVTWVLIGNAPAAGFQAGGAFSDTGQSGTSQQPPMNPLLTYFDVQIQSFFANYQQATGNSLLLSATDGTTDGDVYSFQGTTIPGTTAEPPCLQFQITSVVDASGDPVSSLLSPLLFNVYVPYWNLNSYDPSNPAPPSWAAQEGSYQSPASVMVFAANGVFADNLVQPVPPAIANNPLAVQQYQTLLGSLENQIAAALTRGIANLPIAPSNWGSTAPVQTQPVLTSCTSSSLDAGTTYYYVVTAVYDGEETVPSLEFNATPTTAQPCVQVSWLPLNGPASFNVYRGTASQQENVLVASVDNSSGSAGSWTDSGQTLAPNGPPYVFFPPGVPSDAYDQFFHQPTISLNGAAYASPYDDQGNQSPTLASSATASVSITLGSWGGAAAT